MFRRAVLLLALSTSSVPAFAADIDPERFSQGEGFTWTGVYFGASLGRASSSDTQDNFPLFPGFTIVLDSEGENDQAGGIFLGYMHQMGSLVVGAEFQRIYSNIQYIGEGLGPLPIYLDTMDQFKGRIGWAMGQTLVYGTAGGTYGRINVGLEDLVPMVGGGVDFAINEKLIVGVEYTHSFFDEFDGQPISGTADYLSARVAFKF